MQVEILGNKSVVKAGSWQLVRQGEWFDTCQDAIDWANAQGHEVLR